MENAFAESEIYYGNDVAYSSASSVSAEIENFSYSTKQVVSNRVNASFPDYFNTNPALTNYCANVAGANIIGYYDRFYENLIPDYIPGMQRPNAYIYYAMNVNQSLKQGVIDSLYVSMQTNYPEPGTSQAQYKNGLTSYVNSKNLSISFTSVLTNSAFDFNKVKTQIDNGKPITLYLADFNFSHFSDDGSSVTISKNFYSGNHIAIAYGYEKIDYYNAAGSLIYTITFLYASSGILTVNGVYIVGANGTINHAEAVNIY